MTKFVPRVLGREFLAEFGYGMFLTCRIVVAVLLVVNKIGGVSFLFRLKKSDQIIGHFIKPGDVVFVMEYIC